AVTVFSLDEASAEFVMVRDKVEIPQEAAEFAINASRQTRWYAPTRAFVDACLAGKSGPFGKTYNMRWCAAMVADLHRILCRGGVFLYPEDEDTKGKGGRLRLLYEANPMSMIVEAAGGASTTGTQRLLDIEPSSLHQRIGIIIGSRGEDGVVAVIFAVMAIPFIAMAGWAVDYVRLQHVQEKLQIEADSAALNALIEDVDWEVVHDAAMAEIARNYNGSWAREVQVEGEWLNQYDFRVTASADVPLAFIKLLPGIGDVQRVSVAAVAQVERPDLKWVAPEFSELSYEAADFNRLWLYCYWIDRPEGDPSQPKRTQMVPIADNGGSSANRDLRFVPDPGDPADPDNPI
ncbi:fbp, partial [Symbiodinium necroappetens]